MNQSVRTLLLMILLLALGWRYLHRSFPKQKHQSSACIMPTMRRLRWICYRRTLFFRGLYALLALAVSLACLAWKRTGPGGSLILLLVLLLPALVELQILLRMQRWTLNTLPESLCNALENDFTGEGLRRTDDAWTYCDFNWYICVSANQCVVLWKNCIDFRSPSGMTLQSFTSFGTPKGGGSYRMRCTRLTFTTRDGCTFYAHSEITPALRNWVKNHGGRFE